MVACITGNTNVISSEWTRAQMSGLMLMSGPITPNTVQEKIILRNGCWKIYVASQGLVKYEGLVNNEGVDNREPNW